MTDPLPPAIRQSIRKRLVDDVDCMLHWWSLRFNAVALAILGFVSFDPAAALGAWNMMPGDVRAVVPHNFLVWIGGILVALSMLSRVVKQKPGG